MKHHIQNREGNAQINAERKCNNIQQRNTK